MRSFNEILSKPGIKTLLFAIFMTSFGFGVIIPILPFYALSFGAQPFDLGLLTASFALASFVFSPIFGRLSDRMGRKKFVLLGALGYTLSYLIYAFADSLALVFLARALSGVFSAAIFTAAVSILSDLTTERERGRAMALQGMMFALGLVFGPAFGGFASTISLNGAFTALHVPQCYPLAGCLPGEASVRDAFLLSALLSLANFIFAAFSLREPKTPHAGYLEKGRDSLLHHVTSPLLLLFVSSFMTTFMIGGIDAILALYTSEKLGFTAADAGVVFTYIGVMMILTQFISGALVNKFGELSLIRAGLVLSGAGFLLLSAANGWAALLFAITVFNFGLVFVMPSVTSLETKRVTGKKGAVIGIDSSFRALGEIAGPILAGLLYGISHIYAFAGMAAIIWAYFFVLSHNLHHLHPKKNAV